MNKLRIRIAIIIFLLLIAIGIFLPWIWKTHASDPKKDSGNLTQSEDMTDTIESASVKYQDFERLGSFLSDSLVSDLKEIFPTYLAGAGKTGISDITSLPEETRYPDTNTTRLFFLLSDDTRLPVCYLADRGVFLLGEEEMEFTAEQQIYEKQTDDSLPAVTAEEVEIQQEGGFNDTGSEEVQP